MSFRCTNNKWRNKYGITINSFFIKFSNQKLKIISEIMKTLFLLLDFNTQKAYKYFIEDLNLDVSKNIISKVYKEMRKIISKYINIKYQTTLLGELNLHEYYSVDECNILTIKGTHIWLLGIIDNENKDFQIEHTLS